MKRLTIAWMLALCLVLFLCTAVSAGPTQSVENDLQPITPEILVGLWELDHADYGGMTITAEDWLSFFGELATMEFTSDGTWIMKSGGMTDVYFYEFREEELFAEGGKAPLSLVDGKLVFDTGNGMAMVLTKSEAPGLEGTVSVDGALLGSWVFEQLVYLPDGIPVDAGTFQVLYDMSAPILEVVNVGYAVMQLGDGKRAFTVDEWHLEDGKLVHTDESDDDTSMVWYFVREGSEPVKTDAPAEAVPSGTANGIDTASPSKGPAANGDHFTYHGASWGMSREIVRTLEPVKPIQEPIAATGHTALVYQFSSENGFNIVQYNFLPSDALFNITIMAPDADGAFYAEQRENYTVLYGEPLSEAGADLHSDDDPVAVMMAAMMQNYSGDVDPLGWQADDETVIILSVEPVNKVCYVEIRRYTDYFRFE
ncbi:MAG: hypothetical protein IJR97_14335 [Clostridia bacterium]|nr:hypothetical protein [Clostridia bacterium]